MMKDLTPEQDAELWNLSAAKPVFTELRLRIVNDVLEQVEVIGPRDRCGNVVEQSARVVARYRLQRIG